MSLAGAAANLAAQLEPDDWIDRVKVFAAPSWDGPATTVDLELNQFALIRVDDLDHTCRYMVTRRPGAMGALAAAAAAVELLVGPCQLLDEVRLTRNPGATDLVTVGVQWAPTKRAAHPRAAERRHRQEQRSAAPSPLGEGSPS